MGVLLKDRIKKGPKIKGPKKLKDRKIKEPNIKGPKIEYVHIFSFSFTKDGLGPNFSGHGSGRVSNFGSRLGQTRFSVGSRFFLLKYKIRFEAENILNQ